MHKHRLRTAVKCNIFSGNRPLIQSYALCPALTDVYTGFHHQNLLHGGIYLRLTCNRVSVNVYSICICLGLLSIKTERATEGLLWKEQLVKADLLSRAGIWIGKYTYKKITNNLAWISLPVSLMSQLQICLPKVGVLPVSMGGGCFYDAEDGTSGFNQLHPLFHWHWINIKSSIWIIS